MTTERTVTCMGCNRTATCPDGQSKPWDWFIRTDEDGDQIACSRPCIDIIAKESGKTQVVLPW